VDAHDDLAELEIYLLRHAHAGDATAWDGPDSERPLSNKGRRQAERLGQFLADRAFAPDAILSSPKLRARQTAQLVGDALGIGVTTDDRLAGALDVEVLEALIDGAGGTSVVLVGHDPDFTDLAMTLTGASYLPLKKATLARIDTSLPVQPGTGILRWLLPPDLVADRL
jgi:phosphohistidine phosphatase